MTMQPIDIIHTGQVHGKKQENRFGWKNGSYPADCLALLNLQEMNFATRRSDVLIEKKYP
jgi:hypothetical protein